MNHKLMSLVLVSILLFIVACSPTPTPPPVGTPQPGLVASATPTSTAELPPPPAATPTEHPPTPLIPAVTAESPPPPAPTQALPLPTPQPTPCGPPLGSAAYTIQPGDTLYSISIRTGTSVEQLKLANCLTSDQIYYGQGLFVPYLPVFSAPTAELLPPPPATPPPPLATCRNLFRHLPQGTNTWTLCHLLVQLALYSRSMIAEFTAGEAVNVRVFFGATQEVVFRTSTTTDANGQSIVEFASRANNPVGEYVVWAIGTQTRAVGKLEITPAACRYRRDTHSEVLLRGRSS